MSKGWNVICQQRWRRCLFQLHNCFGVLTASALCLGPFEVDAAPGPHDTMVVDSAEALQAALANAYPGQHIIVLKGIYPVTAPLVVPDGVTLEGEGTMLGDEHPEGFDPGTETRIVAAGPVVNDLVTLEDGAELKGLVIEGVAGSLGNVISVASRSPYDAVAASIIECVIVNPNNAGIAPRGPTGRSIVVWTRNPNLSADPPPHEGAEMSLRMTRTIVCSTANSPALFAINFAPRARITLWLSENVLGGGIDGAAGVSRPDEVTESSLIIHSERNAYVAEPTAFPGIGIQLYGASGAPIPGFLAPATTMNHAQLSSVDDVLTGFRVGLMATGGRRLSLAQGPSSGNVVDLKLQRLQVYTADLPGSADFVLRAALSEAAMPEFVAGDNNTVRVQVVGVTGSGPRQNVYAVHSGPLLPQNFGVGNRLEFIGSKQAFERINEAVEPGPSGALFLSGH